ncbi:helix-turn-helix transcriptional regulator [Kibdelosporangium lantanae]|uniref:Helix-turn-helix transcriptional regulator n=1 Tax=Kibdelosporangium lantanae TaxID=1497396 RepID=A0ABW3M2I5_9PSEU
MTSSRDADDARYELTRQLRKLREKAGLTQEQLAERLGGSRFQVSRIECGRLPAYGGLLAVLETLEVPVTARAPLFRLWELAWQPGQHQVRPGRIGAASVTS